MRAAARWEVSFGRLPDDHPDVETLTVTVQATDRDDAIVKARLAADRLNIHRPIDEVIAPSPPHFPTPPTCWAPA